MNTPLLLLVFVCHPTECRGNVGMNITRTKRNTSRDSPQDQCLTWACSSTQTSQLHTHSARIKQKIGPPQHSRKSLKQRSANHRNISSPLGPEISARCGQSAIAAMSTGRNVAAAASSVDQSTGLCTEVQGDSPSMDHATDLLTGRNRDLTMVSQ